MAEDPVEQGWAALQARSWDEARAAFDRSLLDGETPEALEGLATAASWVGDGEVAIHARERAYRLFRDRADDERAAPMAAAIADNVLTFGGGAGVAGGWLQRARHCLRGHPESPVNAWIDSLEAFLAMAYDRDVERARRLGEAAVERSRRLGHTDMEMAALAVLGVIVVSSGRLADGMRMLDEATAAAVSGDVKDPQAAANIYCALVTASVRVRDLERLARWSRHAMDISRDWPDRAVLSYPRIESAVALTWWGRWREAESDLLGVIDDLGGRPHLAGLAMLRLAELRRRQGRLVDARQLLSRLDERCPVVGMGHRTEAVDSALTLDEGDPAAAVELAERYLRAVPVDDAVERIDGLEALVRASIEAGDTDRAADASRELEDIAAQVPTAATRAAARVVAGAVAAARGEPATARMAQEQALDLYQRAGAPFEVARVRVDLAKSLLALGLTDRAAEEMRTALDRFDAIGAVHHVQVTTSLLAALGHGQRRQLGIASLTPREVEVLRLLAAGRTNDEIADGLVLSIRTVERHVSNIYSKVGAYGRTARTVATAYAYRHALT